MWWEWKECKITYKKSSKKIKNYIKTRIFLTTHTIQSSSQHVDRVCLMISSQQKRIWTNFSLSSRGSYVHEIASSHRECEIMWWYDEKGKGTHKKAWLHLMCEQVS